LGQFYVIVGGGNDRFTNINGQVTGVVADQGDLDAGEP
jgi:hypothetical protein